MFEIKDASVRLFFYSLFNCIGRLATSGHPDYFDHPQSCDHKESSNRGNPYRPSDMVSSYPGSQRS